jgi:two-component system chemotaxis sensor kinase CheA
VEDSGDLIDTFIEEAREHLPVIEASLLALEQQPEEQATLNELFRSVHTIKGGAGFFGLTAISRLTHSMESLLSLARSHKLMLTNLHFDVLLAAQDRLVEMIANPQNSNNINVETECQKLNELINQTHKAVKHDNENTKTITPTPIKPKPLVKTSVSGNEETVPPLIPPKNQTIKPSANRTDIKSPQNLLNDFIEEARESLPHIETCLLAMEINPANMQQLNELFRHTHIIKGGAAFLGLEKIAQLAHVMEDILGLAKNAKLMLEEKSIDALLEGYDGLTRLIKEHENQDSIDISDVCQKLFALRPHGQEKAITAHPESVSTSVKPVINEVNEEPRFNPVPEIKKPVVEEDNALVTGNETEETIRVHVKRLNKLIDLAGELVLVRNQIFRLCEPLIPQTPGLKVILHNFSRITSEMQEEIMSTRMQPVGVIFNRFPRLIRQLEKDLDKQLVLVTEGADVELDKTIIESLTDPVTHIIRNMADHGIETPAERIKKGKPPSGTILQKAFHESGQVIIQLSDDGNGIDPEFVASKALQKDIITAELMEKMSAKEKINLIFTPGFSTAETISTVSGRGIGMDVVKTNIEACGGSIDINSQLGKWTSITMTLPLTMAIISALIVSVQNCRFAFPQSNLEEMVLLEADDYHKKVGMVGKQRMLSLRGNFLPLISLAESLKMPVRTDVDETTGGDKPCYILIIKADNNRVAVIVDQILGSEEIVVKPMPEYFRQIKNFSGTSILGDGAIAMIIDVQGYIQKNQLAYTELQKDSTAANVQRKVEQEPQSLLIFDNNTEEHFALALSWIQRIDSLEVSRIQLIAGHEYIEYRGEQMRLLRLEQCLPVQKPNNYQAVANIIIPKRTKVPVALLINRVIDTKNAVIKLENTATKIQGILGSMLLDGKITLMLDLHCVLETGEPDSVERIEINTEKAKNKRILLVEDTPFFMKVIKECVVSAGYQVTTASNGLEGLETLHNQEFDLVLSDIEMPIMDGREMVKNIRANSRWKNMPVIALTTLNDEQTIADGKKAGFNEWLVKLDKELVLKTIACYL